MEQLTEMGITHDAIESMMLTTPCIWVAEINEQPVGFSIADQDTGSIFALFILPEFEGRGLGRALMALAEAFLFQQHSKIWLVPT